MNLFEQIEKTHAETMGWCTLEKGHALAGAVLALRPSCVIEIGIFNGKSFTPMALALKSTGSGRIIGIDPWDAAESVKNETPENSEWWGKLNYQEIMDGFIRKLVELELTDICDIIRKPSDLVTPPESIDILHIDGSHTDQALRDAQRFGAKVRVGGLCFADDIDWTTGGPRRGVEHLVSIGFQRLYTLDTGAMFQRIKS